MERTILTYTSRQLAKIIKSAAVSKGKGVCGQVSIVPYRMKIFCINALFCEKEKEHSLSIVFSIPNIIKYNLHVWLSSMQQRGAYTIKIVKYLRQNNCQILCGATAPPDSVSCPLLGVNCELVKSSVFSQTRTSQLRHVMILDSCWLLTSWKIVLH